MTYQDEHKVRYDSEYVGHHGAVVGQMGGSAGLASRVSAELEAAGFGADGTLADQVVPSRPTDYPDGKYVIFKLSDWRKMMEDMTAPSAVLSLPHPLVVMMDKAVDDGTVIRRQDVFAAPALAAYANSILVAVEALKLQPGGYNETLVAKLLGIAEYFHQESERAYHENRGKFPD